jgi:3-dehydroquinate dehydratase-1
MKVCASIGAETYGLLKRRVGAALKLGADLVELRLDYLRALSVEKLRDVVEGIEDRCILTLRSSREGGLFKGSEAKRIRLLHRLADLKPAYIDVELEALRRERGLAEACAGVSLIVSKHSLTNTPSRATLDRWVEEVLSFDGIGKVVTAARRFEDNLKVMEALSRAPRGRLIAFCMGELGLASRILAPLLGSPIFYASLKEATAPGQIELSEALRLYRVLNHGGRP